ncbi:sarcosine oxidase subunit delta [Komagataeibacter intermedius]|uniref:Sarcosine oxidase subunit delta n=2 Tax=Komagataeibacter intermedius TaxID=66229 RepID=A0A0N1N521_9PROT|nr:sarcosine oxidase subunit delta [Komagataeibacter intermedius]KPH87982.1 sarcosine oxidase subunit delta [Komagataeibacter intermedius AF2]MCF3635950.1 sarcosine oxidase subunit delta [Komagataeibacter intermedius]GAN86477.1 sarcosine oxidase delta subunit [Komagataeibacter intermedius TF2]GBQ68398.1 sarcosine oxidase delta subunit [Komagataeibacter intermedius NRIC 0521]
MRLNCPCCGPRGLEEFTYRGDATVHRPGTDAPAQAWVEYVYLRDNPDGWHRELWYHGAGCHAWLVVTRNMRTHEIADVARAADVARLARENAGS